MELLINPLFTQDINKMCTICNVILKDGRFSHLLISIHSTIEKLQSQSPMNVIQVLQSFSNFNNYNGPQMVCKLCYDKIRDVFNFIQRCNKAHENVQHYLRYQQDMQSQNQEIIEETMQRSMPEVEIKSEPITISDTQINDTEEQVQTNFHFVESEVNSEYDFKEEVVSEAEDCDEVDMPNIDVDISDDSSESNSANLMGTVQTENFKLLSAKSHARYQTTYDEFVKWRKSYGTKSCSENLMIKYFKELSRKYKPTTLWTIYSMLQIVLQIRENKGITSYAKLNAFLKSVSEGYVPRKSNILSLNDVNKFVKDAPDEKYLLTKVFLIIAISGACRQRELMRLKVDDVKDLDSVYEITIPDTKTKKSRTFTVGGHFYDCCKKYILLRPVNLRGKRFFVHYRNGRCFQQFIGINKIGEQPKEIAKYLKLPNPEMYTGHCFRRLAAKITVKSSVVTREVVTSIFMEDGDLDLKMEKQIKH